MLWKSKIIIFSLFILFTIYTKSISDTHTKDFEILSKLIFPTAYDVSIGHDKKLKISIISYKVRISYPAKEILKFSEKILKKYGWVKKEKIKEANNGWDIFIDGTQKEEPVVHKWSEVWINEEKTQMIILLFKYFSYTENLKEKLCLNTPLNNILNVTIQIGPYKD